MTTAAANALFIDTNVLIYATVPSAPWHAEAVAALNSAHFAGRELWISRQVLREYLAVLTRPQTFTPALTVTALEQAVLAFQAQFHVAEDSVAVTTNLLALLHTVSVGGKQIHDANIVATMQAYGIPEILTHNTADYLRFAAQIQVLPLVP
jgi:predicted nucleic acid-binding protein